MLETVKLHLLSKGIKPHIKGFDYLASAIILCQNNKSYLHNLTKHLYPEIAKQYNEKPTSVARTIRYLLIRSGTRMTNREFLANVLIELALKN